MKIQSLSFVLALGAATAGCAARNAVVEIPENYTGWVTIHYSARDCGRAEAGGWFQSVVEIQADGQGCSTQWRGPENLTTVSFYYVDSSGRRTRELKDTGWGGKGELWGKASSPDRQEYYVYVGPEASFQRAVPLP